MPTPKDIALDSPIGFSYHHSSPPVRLSPLASVTRRPQMKVTIYQLTEAANNSRSQLPILLIFTPPTSYRKNVKYDLSSRKRKGQFSISPPACFVVFQPRQTQPDSDRLIPVSHPDSADSRLVLFIGF